jgi:hypothetical protein
MFMRILFGVLCLAGAATAAVDELEDIGPNDSVVSVRVVGGVVVGMTPFLARTYCEPPNAFMGWGGWKIPYNPEAVSGTRFISTVGNFQQAQPFIFTFSEALLTFGLTTIDLLENVASGSGTVILRALDENGEFLTQQLRTGPLGPSGFDLDWEVTSEAGIKQAILLGYVSSAVSALYGIDDLVVVPLNPIGTEGAAWSAIKAMYR